ncbi:MAG TPA: NUDIX hydrolase [Candidatus Binatia bacterium]|jgi:8-oxo-dGTP pyrophosphatase MutT (NUDIX family)
MSDSAVPNKASTIIVVRPDGNGGFEALMTRRQQQLQFLGGYLVFPGGAVEEQDCSDRMRSLCRGVSPAEACEILGGELSVEAALGHWVSAIRELFEEAGLHYFVTAENNPPSAEVQRSLVHKRNSLCGGTIDLPELLESEGLFCDLGSLAYLFRRITPESYKVRFDTRFYLAALASHQTALDCSEEVEQSIWLPPLVALEQSTAGLHQMLPPTRIALQTLAEHGSWDRLCAAFGLR